MKMLWAALCSAAFPIALSCCARPAAADESKGSAAAETVVGTVVPDGSEQNAAGL